MEEAQGETEKEREQKVEPPLQLSFLKAKRVSTGKQGDNMLVYFNKNHVPHKAAFTRSKNPALICWRRSHINYQKLEFKNKKSSVQQNYELIKNTNQPEPS